MVTRSPRQRPGRRLWSSKAELHRPVLSGASVRPERHGRLNPSPSSARSPRRRVDLATVIQRLRSPSDRRQAVRLPIRPLRCTPNLKSPPPATIAGDEGWVRLAPTPYRPPFSASPGAYKPISGRAGRPGRGVDRAAPCDQARVVNGRMKRNRVGGRGDGCGASTAPRSLVRHA